jgi:hypothetical protein
MSLIIFWSLKTDERGFKANIKIVLNEFLPQWNYIAKPESLVIFNA